MQLLFILLIILTLMPHIASLLDTSLVKKVINFMTWKLRNFSSIMMLNFVRPFFIFSIATSPTPNFVLSHFPLTLLIVGPFWNPSPPIFHLHNPNNKSCRTHMSPLHQYTHMLYLKSQPHLTDPHLVFCTFTLS